MDKRVPKLILKIEFVDGFNVDISLITLNDFYNKNIVGSKIHTVPNNDFVIFEGNIFKIEDGLVSLPDDECKSINKSVIKLYSEKKRYEVLRDLKDALLDWSNSKFWEGSDMFSKTPSIEYKKNLWVLY